MLTILALEFITWGLLLLAWYIVPVTVVPLVIVGALVAYGLTRAHGTVAQVGRGMLIGCAATPLTLLIFIPVYLIAHLFGPV